MGDTAAAALWAEHDAIARELLAEWRGREIDKSDGFLALFDSTADALAYAAAYHRALDRLSVPLRARVGIHRGSLVVRENPPHHVSRGAKPIEVDGSAKPLAARIMSLARPGQTLVSEVARADIPADCGVVVRSHGHWRLKGIGEIVQIHEAFVPGSTDPASSGSPEESPKGWRVVLRDGHWIPARPPPHNLPVERDPFVGRVRTLNEVSGLLARRVRLLTLVGPGGCGKTRLAVHEAWERLGDYPGGAWFVDLTAARTLDGIAHAVASALQLVLGSSDAIAAIGEALATRDECLVVADNFEQVAEFAERTLGRWLERAPKVQFIVTTRQVLGIVGEEAVAIAPLEEAEAVALLKVRAASAGALPFTASDEAALPRLVDLLDRLPLALELAAARTRLFAPAELLLRMNERFRLLAAPLGRHERQATLRATLDWSWDLMTREERSALAQVTAFEGGFTPRAVEAVVDLPREGAAPWIPDVLQSLVDKSLVRKVSGSRFDLLKSLQEYAAERLPATSPGDESPGGREATYRRHWRFYAGMDEAAAIAERGADADNLVVACERSTRAGDSDAAARVLCAAWSALKMSGPFQVAIRLADELIARFPERTTARGFADWVAGCALQQLGQVEAARQRLEAAFASPDAALHCRAQCALGELESTLGRFPVAAELLEQALAAARALDDPTLQCKCMNALGALHAQQSNVAAARSAYEEALRIARREGDRRWEGGLLSNLGGLHHGIGDLAAARACYEDALRMASDAGDRRWEGNIRSNLGLLHHEEGRPAAAREQFEAALTLARHLGHVRLQGHVRCNVGLVEEVAGNLDLAHARFTDAVQAARRLADRHAEAWYRCYLGRLDARLGRTVQAAACLDEAAAILKSIPDDLIRGLFHCASAELSLARGDTYAAHAHLRDARACATRCGAGPGSELGRELTAVDNRLQAPNA